MEKNNENNRNTVSIDVKKLNDSREQITREMEQVRRDYILKAAQSEKSAREIILNS